MCPLEPDDSILRSHSTLNLPSLCLVYETLMPNGSANDRGRGNEAYCSGTNAATWLGVALVIGCDLRGCFLSAI